jgi:putative redox protein
VKATARRRSGLIHDVETDTGHTLVVDEPVEDGGENAGPAPTRVLTSSLAACTSMTIVMYAERKGWDVGKLEVEVNGERGEKGSPSRFDVAIRIPEPLDAEQEKRILTIAGKCPVHRILAGEVELNDHLERA